MGANTPIQKKQLRVLQALCYLSNTQRQAVLRKADPALIRCICECILNILQGTVPLSPEYKTKLKRHVKLLRKLSSKGSSFQNKKKIIIQKGGFLPLFLAPVLGALISNFISK